MGIVKKRRNKAVDEEQEETKALAKTKKGGAMVKWATYDEDTAAEEDEAREQASGGDFFKPQVGRNEGRIPPPPPNTGWGPKGKPSPFKVVYEHRIKIPGSDLPINMVCPKKQLGERCLICELEQQLKRSGSPRDKQMADELYARRRTYFNWIDLSDPERPNVKVWPVGKTIASELTDLRTERGDYTHPTKGTTIVVRRKGTGKNDTTYKVYEGEDLPMDELDIAPDDLFDLDDFAQVPDLERQEAILEEIETRMRAKSSKRSARRQDDEDDEDADERPRRSRSRKQKRRSVQDDVEDVIDADYREVEDDEDDDDDE